MRLRIDLAYDGAAFHGWARQPGLRTVEAELTTALATGLRASAASLRLVCAGRTDAGVHARGQVCHVDVDPDLAARAAPEGPARLVRRLNGLLPPDVRVRGVDEAPAGFDARFSALWRRYVYRVADRPAALDPLARAHVLAWPRELDIDVMHAAAPSLVGRHDFAAFCKQRQGATTIRTLIELDLQRAPSGLVEVTVRADAFCHSMVRSLVGSLLAVGEGRRAPSWPGELLVAGRRHSALTVARACGLTLEQVAYPATADLADRADQTRRQRRLEEAAPAEAAP